MNTVFQAIGFGLLGYFLGSMSFALWVTRWLKGVDVRELGSGHATATNTMRSAGWGPFLLVLVLDIAKGFVPVWLALHFTSTPWIAGIAAAMTVTGHCWPVFAGFRGGMGLAVAGGAILAGSYLGFVIGAGVLIALVLIIHHSARAAVVTGIVLPGIYWLFGWRDSLIWIAGFSGLIIVLRFLSDWNRVYRELWLDRKTN